MKRIYFFLSLLTLSAVLSSCSNDENENEFQVPTVPGVNLRQDEIQLVFRATPETFEVSFSVESSANNLSINWGDDAHLYRINNGKVTYCYPHEKKVYIITILGTHLSKLDLTHNSAQNIIALYAGECTMLKTLKFNRNNLFEAFDLTKCPFLNNQLDIWINTNNFDFKGLKNVRHLKLYISTNTEINLEKYNTQNLILNLDRLSLPKAIQIESMTLKHLELWSYNHSGSGVVSYPLSFVEQLSLKTPKLNELAISYLCVKDKVDLREAGTDSLQVLIKYCDLPTQIDLSSATYRLEINAHSSPMLVSNLEVLDFSVCKNLNYVFLHSISNLKTINLEKCIHLKEFSMYNSPNVNSLNFDSSLDLEAIYCSKNDQLANITLRNLPKLYFSEITHNPQLSSLIAGQLPMLSQINIENNKFNENTILSFLEILPDEPTLKGEKRSFIGFNNPGYTENIRNYISGKRYWELFERKTK